MAKRPAIMQKKCVVMLCGARRNSAPDSAFRFLVRWLSTLRVFPAAVVGALAPCGLLSPQIQFEFIVKGNQHVIRNDSYREGGCSKMGARKRIRASLLSGGYRSLRGLSTFLGAFVMQFRKTTISPVMSVLFTRYTATPTRQIIGKLGIWDFY